MSLSFDLRPERVVVIPPKTNNPRWVRLTAFAVGLAISVALTYPFAVKMGQILAANQQVSVHLVQR